MRDGQKLFKDPIYDLIYFDKEKDRAVLAIIDSPEFQRLRRIRQLGLSSYTYSSTTHDRFSHSIGVCFLAGLIIDNLDFEKTYVDDENEGRIELTKEETKLLVKLAAIVHDIGHGPFSHAFERAIKEIKSGDTSGIQIHERYSINIIKSDVTTARININNLLFKSLSI